MKEYYKITEVARLYGLCTDTLRYYEEQGLLHPHRSEAGYRLYSIDDICNLNVIRALRELDMPVEHMRRYFGERTVASTLDMLCLLYTSPSPRDGLLSRMPSSA